MSLPKSFGRGSLAGQFLGYFIRFYLLVIGVALLISSIDEGPQVVLMRRANQAQLSRAWESILRRTDLEVAEHLGEPGQLVGLVALPGQHPELRRTLVWKGRETTYEFEAEALARRLREELSGEGWVSLMLYDVEGRPLTVSSKEAHPFTFRGTARITLSPLTASAVSINSKPFDKIASPWRVALLVVGILLFPVVTARVFARRVTDPLQALESTSLKLAGGELSARVDLKADNEIGRLGGTLNWMAEQLQEREARLQELNHLKSLFLASVSHELRTPLTAILGQTQMLLDDLRGPLGAEQRDTVGKTQRNAAALLGLIDDLLDLGKIEAGRMDVLQEEFLLEECVRDALGVIEPQLKEKGLALELSLEEAWALGDFARTRQILINLLANAVKFTSQGKITVRVQKLNEEWLTVQVEDTGVGIPEELQERIFEEFRQADSSVSRQFGGTGLGLSIARKLAELQGGKLSVSSSGGATFTLTLPAATDSPEA